jgi:hypothetical protein
VIVPVLERPVELFATEYATAPAPLPFPPAPTVIQLALLTAAQLHPGDAVTEKLPDPPLLENDLDNGEIEETQPAPPWETVNVIPAIVRVPFREVVPAFAAAVKLTVPLPEPLAPDVIVIHESLLTAVQAQPACAVTAELPAPPLGPNCALEGWIEKLHAAAAWSTVKVRPAPVIDPDRGLVVGLAATE